ncbi:MAG: DNA recombination protein RmuC, partial [Verrucomicrobiota bacterium]
MDPLLAALLGAAVGGLAGWFLPRRGEAELARQALRGVEQQLETARAELAAERVRAQSAGERAAAAEAEARHARAETAGTLERLRQEADQAAQRRTEDLQLLRDSFSRQGQEVLRALAPDVTRQVASQVEPLVAALRTSLENVDVSVRSGLQRQGDALAAVRERMEALGQTTQLLAAETNDFTAVLKSAAHRGAWGEQTLRRVVEAAGLSPHCDFLEQTGVGDRRPDLVVRLPGNRCVVIDSKVPELEAAAARSGHPNRASLLRDHAQKLRGTIKDLAGRGYPAAVSRELGLQAFDQVI